MPTVSIIMNCLNGSRHLPEALESARRQTMSDFEIIFWDNCSTDNSAELAKSFDSRLRYFRGEETVPLGAARNLAIAKSRGSHIAFLDCDDLWKPSKLAEQMRLFESSPKLGLACTDTEIFDGKKVLARIFDQTHPQRGNVFEELMIAQWISMSSAMIRREALESVMMAPGTWFDESLNVCEEADLFYRIAHDWEVDFVPSVLTMWRVHGQNTTFRKFEQFADETLKILQKHRQLFPGYDQAHPQLVALLANRATFQKAVALWRSNRGSEARKMLAAMSELRPKHKLFWLASYLPGSFFDLAARCYFALPGFLRK